MPSVNGYSRQTSGRYKAQIIPVNNIIGLDKYYRSAHLLLRQVLHIPLGVGLQNCLESFVLQRLHMLCKGRHGLAFTGSP